MAGAHIPGRLGWQNWIYDFVARPSLTLWFNVYYNFFYSYV